MPAPTSHALNRTTYNTLKTLNARNAAWAKGFKKSRSMAITWMIYTRNRAAARDVYAVLAGVVVKFVLNADYWRKQILVILSLLVWGFSDYATWGEWQIFTIITAFFAATSVKLQELAGAPEQEVQAAFTVFCNMVGSNIPTLCGPLALSAAHPEWFENPKILAWLMPVIFVLSLWTDLLSEGLMNGLGLLGRFFGFISRQLRSLFVELMNSRSVEADSGEIGHSFGKSN
ncbi:hypothetical protein B0H11DRAFT_2078779 [Mycena galericulata]|nr:hypothetical protein B0H11DRAFT_2078779 [Mycena galericulata]